MLMNIVQSARQKHDRSLKDRKLYVNKYCTNILKIKEEKTQWSMASTIIYPLLGQKECEGDGVMFACC